jgi:tRNA 2-thiouridine synthesizing protein A
MIEVDARGLSCPIPVVKTNKAIREHPGVELAVVVDSEVSRENVTRLAGSHGYQVETIRSADEYRLVLRPAKEPT